MKNYPRILWSRGPIEAVRVHVTQKPEGHIFRGSTGGGE